MITINGTAVLYNPEFYIMKHYSYFIFPGALRLNLKGNWAGNAVAFKNLDGSTVIVICNALTTQQNLNFSYETNSFTAQLEPKSFNTFVIN